MRRTPLEYTTSENESPLSRRALLASAGLAAAGAALPRGLSAAEETPAKRRPIKIGQIGTGNQHAYKIGSLRKLTDLFEVVGFVEDDPKRREKGAEERCVQGPESHVHRGTAGRSRPPGRGGGNRGTRLYSARAEVHPRRKAHPPRQTGRRIATEIQAGAR